MSVIDRLEKDIRRHVSAKYHLRAEWRTQTVSYIITTLISLIIWNLLGRPLLLDNGVLALIAFSILGSGASLMVKSTNMLFSVGHYADKQRQLVDDAMLMQYGIDWRETVDRRTHSKVRKRIEKPYKRLKAFCVDLTAYTVFNALLWLGWYLFLSPWFGISQQIPIAVTGIWSVIIVVQFLDLLRFRGFTQAVEKEYQKELAKHKNKEELAKRLSLSESEIIEGSDDESSPPHLLLSQ